jgi:hypothetical protein
MAKAKKKARKKATARRKPSVKPKRKASPPRRTPSSRAPKRAKKKALGTALRAALESVSLESVALEAGGGDGRVQALQSKFDALGRIADALRAQLGKSAADDDRINANIDSLTGEQRTVEAQIAAAQTGTLAPPSQVDVSALQDAIKAADDAIAQSAAVNQLIKAAAELIKTFRK